MLRRSNAILFALSCPMTAGAFAQPIPLVYPVEHTGIDCSDPVLPSFDRLNITSFVYGPLESGDEAAVNGCALR